MPKAKKPDQSVKRGVKTTLSPFRRIKTSRTESAKRYSCGMVTVCERLFLPMRAVGLEKCDVIVLYIKFYGNNFDSKSTDEKGSFHLRIAALNP